MMKKRKTIFICLAVVCVLLLCLIYWANFALELNSYTVTIDTLPENFDGFKIAHVSDVHDFESEKLLELLRNAKPDIIAITGDLTDSCSDSILRYVGQLLEIAPCYYVPGNHESRIDDYPVFRQALKELGVTVLENEAVPLTLEKQSITLAGLKDPAFTDTDYIAALDSLSGQDCTILLSHRPELFDEYVQRDFKLVLSGHAHGGQVRLPFIGGVIAPGQGFFPEYDSGLYQDDRTSMIVSRGIGGYLIPPRVNNRPEVLLVTLKAS